MSALLQNCPQMRVGHDTLFMAGFYRVFLPYSICQASNIGCQKNPPNLQIGFTIGLKIWLLPTSSFKNEDNLHNSFGNLHKIAESWTYQSHTI